MPLAVIPLEIIDSAMARALSKSAAPCRWVQDCRSVRDSGLTDPTESQYTLGVKARRPQVLGLPKFSFALPSLASRTLPCGPVYSAVLRPALAAMLRVPPLPFFADGLEQVCCQIALVLVLGDRERASDQPRLAGARAPTYRHLGSSPSSFLALEAPFRGMPACHHYKPR